jgi:osmotically-inducible protein OsmY
MFNTRALPIAAAVAALVAVPSLADAQAQPATQPPVAERPATAAPAGADRDAMESGIENAWERDAEMKACQGCDIDVEFRNGVATLTGEVPVARYRTLAEKLARIDGVRTVDNKITIDPRSTGDKVRGGLNKAANATVGAVDKAAEATAGAVGTAADATTDAVKGTGEVAGDAYITSKVKAKLTTTDALEGSDIEVSTANNRVTLTGTVPSAAARRTAVTLARGIDGVKDVVDKLTIK